MTQPMDSPASATLDLPSHEPTSAAHSQAQAGVQERFIYIAVPWTPVGGGMYKIADYLIQAQQDGPQGHVLRPLDTRGSGSAAASLVQVMRAVAQLVRDRKAGRVAGVHVNMAERLDFVRESIVLAACSLLRIPTVLHLHAAQLHHSYRRFPAPLQALVRWIFSLPRSCVVLGRVSSDFVTRELRVPAERVEIVINGVPEPQEPRRPVTPTVGKVLFVGNLSERKGVPELLEALAHPALAGVQLQLTLAGTGDIDGFQERAHQLGVSSRVYFHGWATQDQVAQLLGEADALVLPSHDEGLPLAILEALAHGVAVVCTPVGEIPHVLSHGHTACFVEPGEPASIARGLAMVLRDTQMRERLERKGKALHEAQFSLEHFAASIARIHKVHFGLSAVLPAGAQEQQP